MYIMGRWALPAMKMFSANIAGIFCFGLKCTSVLNGMSSVSAISELKVYSDSLLLWVESVLLCPGLGTFCKANKPSTINTTQLKQA